MEIYKQLHSILKVNNKKILVTVHDWAPKCLTDELYRQFLVDRQEAKLFYDQFEESGELTRIVVYKEIVIDHGRFKIPIGFKYAWTNVKQSHPKYQYWQLQFSNDPNVTYHPEILEV